MWNSSINTKKEEKWYLAHRLCSQQAEVLVIFVDCGLKLFFPFSFLGIVCIWLMSWSHTKEEVGKLKKVDRNISWELSHGDKMNWTKERLVMRTVWGPTSVDTVNFPTAPRRPVWHGSEQLQSADRAFQPFHQSLHRVHPGRTQEHTRPRERQAGLASWHHRTSQRQEGK